MFLWGGPGASMVMVIHTQLRVSGCCRPRGGQGRGLIPGCPKQYQLSGNCALGGSGVLGTLPTCQLLSPPLDGVGHGEATIRESLDSASLGASEPEPELWASWGPLALPYLLGMWGCWPDPGQPENRFRL